MAALAKASAVKPARVNSLQSITLPAELRLAIACCRAAFSTSGREAIVEHAGLVDWTRFLTVARRHRIEGLVWHGLGAAGVAAPEPVANQLAASARSIADHGLRAAAESARLLEAFERDGIAPLFIKGLTVAKLAYGNPFLKMSWDLDILVPLDVIGNTATLLEEAGYRLLIPAPSDFSELIDWHRQRKESLWSSADGRLHIELHSRLMENPRLIPQLGVHSPRQRVEVAPNISLPTLARDELIAYLFVHGASSAWHRLKWLSDVAALLTDSGIEEIARLHAASQRLGAGRAAGQALLLAHLLFGTEIGEELEKRLSADRVTRWLVRIALRYLIGNARQQDPTDVRLGTLLIHLCDLLVAPGWTGKIHALTRKTSELLVKHRNKIHMRDRQ